VSRDLPQQLKSFNSKSTKQVASFPIGQNRFCLKEVSKSNTYLWDSYHAEIGHAA
jgi:hypothetical protein